MRAPALALLGLSLAACGGVRTTAGPPGGERIALPAPATALVLGDEATDQGLDALWALHPGGVSTVTPRLEGGGAVTRTLAMPGADPVAVSRYGQETFILDRASEAVLVFDEMARWRATVKVGTRPRDLLVSDFNGDQRPDLAVANEGSNDVSIVLSAPEQGFLPERRVATGERPRALAYDDFDHEDGFDLAVANAGSGTVSLLLGHTGGDFTHGPALGVGAGPVALLDADIDGDDVADLIAEDSLDGTLAVLLGTGSVPRPAKRITLPGGASSEPVALAAVSLPGRDTGIDVYVAERGNGAVQVLHVDGEGRFKLPRTVLAAVHPVALVAGSFGGDRQADVAVADDAGRLLVVVTKGASLVTADPRARSVTAGAGAIVWSRRLGPNRYGLANEHGDLAVPASRRDPRPRIGRTRPGAPILTRRRCGRERCAPLISTLTGARERRVRISVPAGCEVRDLARWDADLAYVLVRTPTRGCPRRAAGLWLRRGPARARRMSRFADALGDLRNGRVTWHETLDHGSGWRLRVATLDGKPRTVVSGNLDCCLLAGGALGTDAVYWVESPDTIRASLGRARFSELGKYHCEYLRPGDGFPWGGGLSADGDTPVYSDEYGVFRVDAPRWARC